MSATFLVPAVLAGAAAIAAPIAIHFLNKSKVTVVRWGAMRFLQESLKKNQKRLRIEDLVLLLLRCLIVILLALAFARFVLNPSGARDAVGSGPVAAVIVLDQSASMGQSNGFQTRFEQATAVADDMLANAAAGSQFALFLAGSDVTQVIAQPTSNLPAVRRALELAKVTNEAADLASAVRAAADVLQPFSGVRREIHILSDGQEFAWRNMDALKGLAKDLPDLQVNVVDLGAVSGEDNVAITGLRTEGRVAAVGQPTRLLAEVRNFGVSQVDGLRVTLAVDDGAPVDEAILDGLVPGGVQVVRLVARLPEAGFYTLRASIPADRLPADNERAVAVPVIDHINITLVEGKDPAGQPDQRDAYFLANALVPVRPGDRDSYYLQVDVTSAAWLQSGDLARQAVIILANLPELDDAAASRLESYVRDGGALVIFPGARVQPASYNDHSVLAALLPATLGTPRVGDASADSLAWQASDYSHPVTGLWNDSGNGSLGSVRAGGYFPLLPKDGLASRVMVEYDDGTPAAVEMDYGRGKVVLFSSSATTDWSNLPIHPQFVPFMHRLVDYLAPVSTASSLVAKPGATIQIPVASDDANQEVTVIRPEGNGEPQPAGRVETVQSESVIRYRDTADVGAYRFFVNGEAQPAGAFAIQMDPDESNLEMLSADALASIGSAESSAESETSGEATATAQNGVRREFWIVFLIAAFLASVAEMVLAHRFSFSK